MPQFDRSQIHTFTIPGDATNIYCMIDAGIVAAAKAGLTVPQQAVVESRRWVPTDIQLYGDYSNPLAPIPPVVSTWAGNSPPAVYFRATQAQMQAALAKYWK